MRPAGNCKGTHERQVKEATIRELIQRIGRSCKHVGGGEWSEARGYLVAQIAEYMDDADFMREFVKEPQRDDSRERSSGQRRR